MKTSKTPKGGLSHAQDQINGLRDELDRTLSLVNELSDSGDEPEALKLLEEQRRELYRVVNSISQDVAASDRSWFVRARRNATAMAAAAALALSTVAAVSMSVIIRQGPAETPTTELSRAATIPDVTERLRTVIKVYRETSPDERAEIRGDLATALQEAIDDAKDENAGEELIDQAEAAMQDLEEGNPPKPPSAPGGDQGPVESVTDLLPGP